MKPNSNGSTDGPTSPLGQQYPAGADSAHGRTERLRRFAEVVATATDGHEVTATLLTASLEALGARNGFAWLLEESAGLAGAAPLLRLAAAAAGKTGGFVA